METQTQTLRVLCIDDDVHVLSFLTDTLESEGYHVETAVDGAHALQKVALGAQPYNLIIVDARMPHLDGWRFIVQARAGGYRGKIIVFSGHLDEHERQRYGPLEIDRIIEKPPKPGELLLAINQITAPAA